VKPEADPFERLHDKFEQALTTLCLRTAGAARNAFPRWSVGTIKGVAVNGRIESSRSSQDNNATQQIRVLEGSPARLRVGRETPYTQPVWVETPYGMQRVPATAIRETGRWLNVAPTLQGEQVLLDIQPESAQINPQHPRSTDVQSLSTRVRVPLGQWVPLGGVDSREQQQINGQTSAQSQSNQTWVRVELAD